MNRRCFKTIFSKRLGAVIAVGEHASSQTSSPGGSETRSETASGVGRFIGCLALTFAWISLSWAQTAGVTGVVMPRSTVLTAPAPNALPQGGQVVQGSAGLNQAGNTLNITQNTAKAVINWQSFDIGVDAKVNVLQPSSQSVLLNRVLSDNPTQIFGQLNANGQVVLVNPKGIVVGSDGSISASAFTASTLNITDADFMVGKEHYTRDGSTGQVINKGRIEVAPGGYVALLGASVSNEGQIIAPQGGVVLGAAETITVPVGRTGKIKLELTPASINATVANQKGGVIVAEGGQVYMQAAALNDALATVLQSGHIDVSGEQGGGVHLLSDGGVIKADGSITANSTGQDDQGQTRKGGDIVIGRDEETGVLAKITDVSGAKLESRTGFVETSGDFLKADQVRVKAAEWLLDPTNITIATNGTTTSGTAYTSSYSAAADSVILASDINASLNNGTSVTLATSAAGSSTGNIAINESISKTGGGDATLTLQAHANINVAANKTITSTMGKLNVVFNSDSDATNGGGIVFNTGSGITSNGGHITLGGGTALNGAGFAIADGVSTLQGISLNSTIINAGGGNISMKGKTAATNYQANLSTVDGLYMTGGSITTTGSGTIDLSGYNQNTDTQSKGIELASGTITGGSTGAVTIVGDSRAVGVVTPSTSSYIRGALINNTITSTGGNLNITGYGGSGAQYDYGVDIGGSVIAVGSGAINITGTAGAGGSGGNVGVNTSGSGTISSVDGAIAITGTGGIGSGAQIRDHGVQIGGTNAIKSTGSGSITVTGTVTNSDNAYSDGVLVSGGGLSTNTGNIKLDGTAVVNYQKAVDITAAVRSTTGNIYIRSPGANITTTSTGVLSANNISIDNSNGTMDTSTGVITPGSAGASFATGVGSRGIDINSSITAVNNLNIYGNHTSSYTGVGIFGATTIVSGKNVTLYGKSSSSNGVLLSGATLTGQYINATGATTTGNAGFVWQGGNINTTGTAGTSTASVVKGISAASGNTLGYGAFMMIANSATNAASGTSLTFAGEATNLAAGVNTNERGILVQGGYTLAATGDITFDGSSKSSEGIAFGGTVNMGTVAGVTNKLTIKGTAAASTNNGWNAINFSGAINGNAATSSINFMGDAKNLSGANKDNGVNISGVIAGSAANVNIQSTGGTIVTSAAISGANISIDNTNGSINSSTGAITAGTATAGSATGISIGANVTATANLNLLGVSTSATGINLAAAGTLSGATIQATGNTGSIYGLDLAAGSSVITTGSSGASVLTGNGASTGGSGNAAVMLRGNTLTAASGSTLTVAGNATTSTTANYLNTRGLRVEGATTTNGAVTLSGTSKSSDGLLVQNGTINVNSGSLTLNGMSTPTGSVGGTSGVSINKAITLNNGTSLAITGNTVNQGTATVAETGVSITAAIGQASGQTTAGNISITGSSGSYANSNGVVISSTGTIATGSGNIAIVGQRAVGGMGAGVSTAASVTSTSGNVTLQSIGGTVTQSAGTISGANISIDNTGAGLTSLIADTTGGQPTLAIGTALGGSINATTGAITAGSRLNVNGGSVSIAGALSTPGNINILGNVATTTNSGVSLAGTGSATTSGAGSIIKIQSNGNIVDGGAIGNTGSSGATSSINLTSTSGSVSGSGTLTSNGVTASGGGMTINTALAGTMSGAISGTGSLTKMGAGTTILTAANSYSGTTTVSAGVLQVGDGGTTGTLGTGAVIDNASLVFNRSNSMTVANAISGTGSLTQSGAGTTILTSDNSYAGTTTVSGGTLQIGDGGITGTLGTGGAATLSNSANLNFLRSAPTTIANNISGVGNVSASITGAASTLTVSNPINLTGGTVNLAADNNISVAAAIATTNTTSSAVLLNAGKSTNAGTSTGGDILFSGSGTVSVGTGGRATLMTGSVSGSAGLTALVGASSGHFRYNSDETTTNYSTATTPLGTGLYSIYREAPVITATVNSVVKTYDGTTYSGGNGVGTFSGLLNGESAQLGTITYTGTSQGAKNANTSPYALGATASSGLGYAVSLTAGTLTINKANLTQVTAAKTYDGLSTVTAAQMIGISGINGETFSATAGTAAISDKNVITAGKTLNDLTGLTLTGNTNQALSSNYNLSSNLPAAGANNAVTINAKTVSLAATKTYDGSTDMTSHVTVTTGVTGESLGYTGVTANSKDVISAVRISAITLTDTGTALASNYQLPSLSVTSADNTATISKANLTQVTAAKTYDRLSTVTGSQMTVIAGVNGETFTSSAGTATISSPNVATANKTLTDLSGLTLTGNTSLVLSSNYNLSSNLPAAGTNNAVNITTKTLTPTITASDKTYDQTNTATLTSQTISGVISGDTVSLSPGSANTFASANVARSTSGNVTSQTVTATGLSLSGAQASNYALSSTTATTSATINPKSVTVAITASDKTYDQTAVATVNRTTSDIFSSDAADVTIGSTSNTFASANVARDGSGTVTSQTVTSSGLNLTGAKAGNYALTNATATTSATISPKSLTVSIAASDKTYDKSNAAAITSRTSADIMAGDAVTIASTSDTFASANVARNGSGSVISQTVTASGLTLAGAQAGNYALSGTTATTNATITPKTVSLTATKTYDGNTALTGSQLVLGDLLSGESLSFTGATLNDKNVVGAAYVNAVTLVNSGTTLASNYQAPVLTAASTSNTASVTPAALSAGLTGTVSKVYDATTTATLSASNFNLTGWVGSEGASVSQTAGTYASAHVDANGGTGAVSATLAASQFTANSGTLLSNYTLPTSASGNVGTITPAALTVNVGNTSAFVTQNASTAIDTGVSYDGFKGADTEATALTTVPTASNRTYTGTSNTPSVGNYSAVYGLNITPTAQHGDYTVTVQKGDLQVIAADKLLVTVASQSDTYGNRTASTAGQASNVTAQYCFDASNCNGTNLYNVAMVAGTGSQWSGTDNTGTTVSFQTTVSSTGNLSGGGYLKAGNYNWGVANLSATAATPYNGYVVNSGTLTVNKLDLTPTANNVTKVYDGTTSAAGVTLNTLQAKSGDTVSALAGSGTYTTKNVVSNDTITFGSLTLSGSDKDNYALAVSAVQGTGSITPANLTVTATAVTKTYDGTTSTTSVGSVGALAGAGDVVNSHGTESFVNKNAGTGKTVQASGVTIKDAANVDMTGNYNITYVDNTTSVINKADLTVTAAQVAKTYDGTTTATGTGSVGTLAGAGAGDVVNAQGSQVYTNKAAGTGKTVQASGVTIKDATNTDVTGNYNIAYVDNTTSVINKADLTVTATAVSKTYDGTTTATGTGTVGTLAGAGAGEVINSQGSQAFLDKNAGAGNKTVQASGVTIKDASNADVTGNYSVTYVNNTASTITPAALSANLTGTVSKVYDATTNATLSSGNFNVTGWVGAEGASVTQTAGTYASPHVDANGGTGAVSANLTSSQLSANSGTLLSNYTLPTSASGNVGTITPAALSVNVGNTASFVTQDARTAIDTGMSYTGLQGADTAASALVQVPVAANRTYTGTSNTPTVGNYSSVYGLNFTPTAQHGNYTVTVQKGNLQVIAADQMLITVDSQTATYGTLTASTAGQASNVTAQYCFDANNCNGSNLYNLSMTAGGGNTWSAQDNAGATVSVETTVTTAGNLSSSGYLKASNYAYGVTNIASTPASHYSGVVINGGTLTVNKLNLSPTTNSVSKVYDGSTSAAGVTLNLATVKSGDAVTATAASGSYTTKNVVSSDTVTFGGLSLSGMDKDNYALAASTVQTSGAITPRALTLQAISDSKTYDGSTSSTGTVTVSGLAPSATDSVTSLTQSFASKNVLGTNGSTLNVNSGYTVNDGNSGNNYTVSTQSASGTITPKSLNLAAVTDIKTYDGTTTSTANVVVTGIASGSGDTVTGLSQTFGNKNVLGAHGSTLSVNSGYALNDGNSGQNYTVTTATAVGTITPKTLSLAAGTDSKVYDGTTASSVGVTVSGIASGSGDTVTGLTQAFGSKNVLGTNGSTLSVNAGYSINDGNSGQNYAVSTSISTGTITPKSLTLAAVTDSKIYDGTTGSSVNVAVSGIASGSGDTVTHLSQAFGSKNVLGTNGSSLTVSSGYTINDGNSGNNYTVGTQAASGTITPKALTLAAVTDTKTYDGTTTSAAGVTVTGIASGSGDTVTGLTQAFGNKNVLGVNGSTLSVNNGYTVNDGNSGRNYSVGTTGTTGTITPADLIVAATQVTKTYDASVNATGHGTVGSLAGVGDSVNSQGAQAFLNANAGTGKTVRASGVTIKDASGQNMTGNYNVIYADNTTSTITPAALTITANADARFVTQADATGYNGVNYSGLVGGESNAVLNGTLAITRTHASTNVAAGTYANTLVPSGLTSGNYTISYVNGNYTVVPANALLIRTTNTSTTYGSTPAFSTTAQYLDGANVIHTLTRSVIGSNTTFSDNAGGSVTVNLQPYSGTSPAAISTSGNTVVGNYLIEDVHPLITGANFVGTPVFVGNLAVNQKSVTPNANGVTKVYDGTTVMANATLNLTGQLTGDILGVSGSGVFTQKNAGTQVGYAFGNLALSGADQGNYFFSGGNSLTGTNGIITPAPLRLTTTNVTKTYDGTLSAAGSATVTSGTQLFGQDSISGGSFAFTNKNAGNANKTVTTAAVTINDGNNGGNYAVSYVDNTTSTINQAALTITATAAHKTYDGNLSATGTGVVGTLAGAGDSIANAGSLSFTDKNAGTGKTVTVTSAQIKDSSGADTTGNYAITYANSNSGVIDKANATLSETSKTVTYNGATQTQNAPSLSGFVAGDDVQASGVASGRNAGTYGSNLIATGSDAGNYNISYVNAPLVINKLGASITASSTSLVYNGQTQSQGAAVLSGFIVGDSVTATGLASGRNVGQYTSALSVSGADAGNYLVSYGNATLNITPKAARISATESAVTYNASTQTQTAITEGLVAGDDIQISGLATGRNVGRYTSNLAATGSDLANYALSFNNASLTIGKAALTFVNTLVENKIYDGTTQANVSSGRITGLVGNETLNIGSVAGQFDTASAGDNKPVTVLYDLRNGENGGLISNYEWTPVVLKANIIRPTNERVPLNALPRANNAFSRIAYQGFGGVSSSGAAVGQSSPAQTTQACSPLNLEDCICETPINSTLEICYPIDNRATQTEAEFLSQWMPAKP